MKWLSRKTHKNRGNVAIEFAVLMPIFLLLVGGIIDFGRAYWFKQSLTWASREGARKWSIMPQTTWDVGTVQAAVIDSVKKATGVQLATENVTVTPTAGPSGSTQITVTVTMPFNFLMIPYNLNNLSGETTMRFEAS